MRATRSTRRLTCSTAAKRGWPRKLPGAAGPNSWKVNQWLKKAVLLSFRLNDNVLVEGGPGQATWWDKIPSKMEGWGENRFKDAGFRAVPGAIVRRSAFIARDVVLMPSFVNLGAYVDEKTMVDTWVTVGSCAQIGKNVHLSGGVGIGGVLEPLQANPTIIEDDCFIGARSEVVEGVIVGQGSVLSMGVFISASTKVIDRATGAIHIGHVPPYSVVVPGALPRQAPARRLARALALLRRNREDCRRADAGENWDQRAFEGVRGPLGDRQYRRLLRTGVRLFAEGLPPGLDFGAKLISVNGQHAMGQCDKPFAIMRRENVAQPRGCGVLGEREGRHTDAHEPPEPSVSGDSPP